MSDRFGTISISPAPQKQEQETSPPEVRKPDRRKKPRRRPVTKKPDRKQSPLVIFILVLITLCFGLYAGFGFYLVPVLIKKFGPARFEETVDLSLTLDRVTFNPLNFTLFLEDFTINSKNSRPDDPALLKVGSLYADLDLGSLLRNGLVCHKVEISEPEIQIIRYPDKRYNLPTRQQQDNVPNGAEIIEFAKLPFLFSLNNITVDNGKLLFDDRLNNKHHSAHDLRLALPVLSNFSYRAKEYIRPHFSAVINGSPFEMSGEAAFGHEAESGGLATKLTCDIHNLDLPLYLDYLPKSFPLRIDQGKGNGKLQLSFTPDTKQNKRLTISFQLSLSDARLNAKETEMVLTVPKAKFEGQLTPVSRDFRLSSVILREPQLSVTAPYSLDSLATLLPKKKEGDKSALPGLSVDLLIVDNGSLTIVGKKPEKKKKKGPVKRWSSIQLSVKNYSSHPREGSAQGAFRLTGERDDGPATISWQGTFDKIGLPRGSLQLNKFEARYLLDQLGGISPGTVGGSADVRGHLLLKNQKKPRLILKDTMVELHDLTFGKGKERWLEAKTVRVTGATPSATKPDLGNISIENAAFVVNPKKTPPFLRQFSGKKTSMVLRGLDYSGSITLKSGTEKNAGKVVFDHVTFRAGQLAQKKQPPENCAFTARLSPQGEIKGKGSLGLLPFNGSFALAFSMVPSEHLFPLLPQLPLSPKSRMTLHGKGTLIVPGLNFSGKVQMEEGKLNDDDGNLLFSWEKAIGHNLTITDSPLHLGISSLAVAKGQINLKRTQGDGPLMNRLSHFFHDLTPTPVKQQAPGKTVSTKIALLDIDEISLRRSAITYEDQRLEPPWKAEITNLHGSLHSVSHSPAAETAFQFSGELGESSVVLSGTAKLFDEPLAGEGQLSIKGLPLNSFSEQLAKIGINPYEGHLDLNLRYNRDKNGEKGTAHFLFSGILPSTRESATALPLALLTNQEGQFELLVNNDSRHQPPLFQQTVDKFKTLLLKASISPFLLAGSRFLDLKDEKHIHFDPGKTLLKDEGKKLLQRFQTLFDAHPRLALEIRGVADPVADRESLKKMRLREITSQAMMVPSAKRSPTPGQTIPNQPIAVPPSPAKITIDDFELKQLAYDRAFNVYDYCTTELGGDSKNFILLEEVELAMDAVAGHRVDLRVTTNAQSMEKTDEQQDNKE